MERRISFCRAEDIPLLFTHEGFYFQRNTGDVIFLGFKEIDIAKAFRNLQDVAKVWLSMSGPAPTYVIPPEFVCACQIAGLKGLYISRTGRQNNFADFCMKQRYSVVFRGDEKMIASCIKGLEHCVNDKFKRATSTSLSLNESTKTDLEANIINNKFCLSSAEFWIEATLESDNAFLAFDNEAFLLAKNYQKDAILSVLNLLPNASINAHQFWSWFSANEKRLYDGCASAAVWEEIDAYTHMVAPELGWEIGPTSDDHIYFSVSPELDEDLIVQANNLIAEAYTSTFWEFLTGMQRRPWPDIIQFVNNWSVAESLGKIDISDWCYVVSQCPRGTRLEVIFVSRDLISLNEEKKDDLASLIAVALLGEIVVIEQIGSIKLIDELEQNLKGVAKPVFLLPHEFGMPQKKCNDLQ